VRLLFVRARRLWAFEVPDLHHIRVRPTAGAGKRNRAVAPLDSAEGLGDDGAKAERKEERGGEGEEGRGGGK
jgi:hypothetical protein